MFLTHTFDVGGGYSAAKKLCLFAGAGALSKKLRCATACEMRLQERWCEHTVDLCPERHRWVLLALQSRQQRGMDEYDATERHGWVRCCRVQRGMGDAEYNLDAASAGGIVGKTREPGSHFFRAKSGKILKIRKNTPKVTIRKNTQN